VAAETTSSDVLVIGGGIAGMLIAWELRRLGASVTLVERGRLGMASSALNAGGVREQFFQEENVRAAMATVAFLAAFRAEHGIDIGFRQHGYLYLYSTGEQRDRLQEGLTTQNAAGVPSRLVTLDEVRELAPAVNTEGLLGGCYGPTDGYLNPRVLMPAIAQITRRSGVTVAEDTPVAALRIAGDRVTGAVTAAGTFTAGLVVNAAGAWAPEVAAQYGGSLPITARRSQVFAIDSAHGLPPVLPAGMPHSFDLSGGFYVRPAGDGAWSGAAFKPVLDSAPATLDAQWVEAGELHRRLGRRVPVLAGHDFTRAWAGVIEVTPDDNPIIGWTGPAGLYTAAGFSGHGMCIAPGIAGPAAAEILGADAGLDLGLYRPERFQSGAAPRPEGMWLSERPAEFAQWAAPAETVR
jgi:sarcosine oxidase subunit beta